MAIGLWLRLTVVDRRRDREKFARASAAAAATATARHENPDRAGTTKGWGEDRPYERRMSYGDFDRIPVVLSRGPTIGQAKNNKNNKTTDDHKRGKKKNPNKFIFRRSQRART